MQYSHYYIFVILSAYSTVELDERVSTARYTILLYFMFIVYFTIIDPEEHRSTDFALTAVDVPVLFFR